MDKSYITHIRPVAVCGCTKILEALADDFSKIVRLPLTTIACGGTLKANPSYSHIRMVIEGLIPKWTHNPKMAHDALRAARSQVQILPSQPVTKNRVQLGFNT